MAMRIIDKMREQNCVYWAPAGLDGYNQQSFATPVQLTCRWTKNQEKVIDAQGNEIVSRAKVYLESYPELGGYLKLGDLPLDSSGDADSSYDDPLALDECFEIVARKDTPTLNARQHLYPAWL